MSRSGSFTKPRQPRMEHAMAKIQFEPGAISVDASLIGEGLALEVAQVPALMRAGEITSRCEHGVDEDAGRYRLSFFHQRRCLRLTVDADGRILQRMTSSVRAPSQPGAGAPAM